MLQLVEAVINIFIFLLPSYVPEFTSLHTNMSFVLGFFLEVKYLIPNITSYMKLYLLGHGSLLKNQDMLLLALCFITATLSFHGNMARLCSYTGL